MIPICFWDSYIHRVKRRSHYSDNQSPTNDNRRPSTTIDNQLPTKFSIENRSPTNCQSLGDRTPTEFRIIIKIWKPIGDWLSQNQRLVGNHSAIDCQAHKRSFDVMHKFVTSFVFLMHRKDFGAKIWTLFLKRNCNNRMIKESYNSPKFSPKNCTRLCFMLYQNLTITSASAGKLLKMKKNINTYIK